MQIKIAQRLRPYSHVSGEKFVLPGSFLGFEIFPTLMRVYDLSGRNVNLIGEHTLNLKGPVADFTIQQDLEKKCLRVWGHYKEGYVRYRISSAGGGKSFAWTVERSPEGFDLGFSSATAESDYQTLDAPRLSLGNHQAQDWQQMRMRNDLTALLPIWFRLGQMMPQTGCSGWEGNIELLQRCKDAEESGDKLKLHSLWLDLFHAGFVGGLYPRLVDAQHQGYGEKPVSNTFEGSPLFLLAEGSKLIQNLFIKIAPAQIDILKVLPPQFHCGRFLDIPCGEMGRLSMEWTKKSIRRMIFRPASSDELLFHFQHGLKRFRLRAGDKDRGRFVETGHPIKLTKDFAYLLDKFEQ